MDISRPLADIEMQFPTNALGWKEKVQGWGLGIRQVQPAPASPYCQAMQDDSMSSHTHTQKSGNECRQCQCWHENRHPTLFIQVTRTGQGGKRRVYSQLCHNTTTRHASSREGYQYAPEDSHSHAPASKAMTWMYTS